MKGTEYEREKRFMELYFDHVMKARFDSGKNPLVVLEGFERESMAKARKSLSLALNDVLEDTMDWQLELVRKFDALLVDSGAATLSELRVKRSSKYQKVLKRGMIKGDVEYYFIKGIVDGAQEYVAANELERLSIMLVEFEKARISGISGP